MILFPETITTNYIISQVFGFISVIVLCASYFVKRDKLLLFNIIGNVVALFSYFFLSANIGWIGTVIGTIRFVIFYLYERKDTKIPLVLMHIFNLAFFAVCFMFWQGFADLFCLGVYSLFTYCFAVKDEISIRYCFISALLLSTLYNLFILNFFGVVRSVLELTIIIISLIRLLVRSKKHE